MSDGQTSFNGQGLLFEMLLRDGIPASVAASVSENANQNAYGANEVAAYLTKAWNMTPSTMPVDSRASYAYLILTAMRGNAGPLDRAISRQGADQPWLKSLDVGPPDAKSVTLAWAQHYMHSRDVTSHSGDENFERFAINMYDAFRRLGGNQNANSSAPSPEAIAWAQLGASQGASDYRNANPGQSATPGALEYVGSIASEAGWKARESVSGSISSAINQFKGLIPDIVKAFSNLPIGTAAMACNASSGGADPNAELSVSAAVVPSSASGPIAPE